LLNFQNARNATKMVPLRPSRSPDSNGIFTFTNGVRMEKLSLSVRRAKQAKNLMLTGQVVQLTWHRPYSWRGSRIADVTLADVSCDVANSVADKWANYIVTHGLIVDEWKGATWPNQWLPHGTLGLAIWFIKIIWRPRGSTPGPPPPYIVPTKPC